jgi:aminopeptidase N
MRDATPATIYRKDYRKPCYWVDTVDLHFDLRDETTTVRTRMQVRRRKGVPANTPFRLDGQELELVSVHIDGQLRKDRQLRKDDESLTLQDLPPHFTLEIETQIRPEQNTKLEGLYKSGSLYCTQCEAEGFRRITYFPDRPDVMARYRTTITADKTRYPVLLSNGNLVESGELEGERHWCTWVDPYPKPSYLFAMVAGPLALHRSSFRTRSGRKIDLRLYVEPHNRSKTDHAMRSLKQAMKWDEDVFGLEYDLDTFMIVAVDDFNMGAMENKGLNIFNTSCVLARPDTATDADFDRIQSIVGHEYFHNWTGNRVTCRDWFQLSLKEGLTVFRDQEFSADLNSRAVKRIEEVRVLREHQFPEDDGPTAHPVRPDQFIEISNFYTSTIYRKGAEVIRMMHTLIGAEAFHKGMNLYFERHDGQAVTTDDFVRAMADASRFDLCQFKRWYTQAGTPELDITTQYDATQGILELSVRQHTPATPGQEDKKPLHLPLLIGCIDRKGNEMPVRLAGERGPRKPGSRLLELRGRRQTFRIKLTEKPILSLCRNFSAPVRINHDCSSEELAFQLTHDSDAFNRWEAGQQLANRQIRALMKDPSGAGKIPDYFFSAFGSVLTKRGLDRALIAEVFTLPGENYLADTMPVVDVPGIHQARHDLHVLMAERLREKFDTLYATGNTGKKYSFNARDVASRRLRNVCLAYLAELPDADYVQLCLEHFMQADNMTDALGALVALVHRDCKERELALDHFYDQWWNDRLVVNKWLAVQALSRVPGTLKRVKALMRHEAFDLRNPNKVRALIGTFCNANPAQFHAANGEGYRFLTDIVIELDELNPQVAAGLLRPLTRWHRHEPGRQALMREELERILSGRKPSRDVYEIVARTLQ